MLKVQNKKVISRLSIRILAAKRNKNLVTILAIILTAMMFTALFTIAGAMNKSMQESTMRMVGGRSMAGVKYILPWDYEKLSTDSVVKNPSYRILVGQAENEELLKVNTEINYAEDENAKDMFCYPTKGKMPKERLEIATSTVVLDALGLPYELGETVTLTFSVDNKKITQDFTLSGYWEGDVVSMAQECWVSKAYCDEVAPTPQISFYEKNGSNYAGYWMMDFDYANSWDIEEKTIALLERNGYDSSIVSYGINWAYTTSSIDMGTVVFIILVLCLILASGYLIIYNIFSLNVVGDIQSYGLLKTIGTTEKQLKRLVRRQAVFLSLIGIPCGLVIGTIIGKCLFPIVVSNFETGGVIKFSMHPLLFAGAAVFSFLTVWVSCNKPCKLAAKVSPIEAVRYADTSYHGKRKEKRTKKVTTFSFGWANVGRNRKKVVVVVLSLSLSMILFNSVYTLVSGFDKDKFISQYLIGDGIVTDATILNVASANRELHGITPEIQQELEEIEGIETIHNVYCEYADIKLDHTGYDHIVQYMDENPQDFSAPYMEQDIDRVREERLLDCNLYALDQWGMGQIEVHKGKMDWEKFKTGNYILINTYCLGREENEHALEGMFYDVGEKLELELPDGKTKEYEVMAIIDMPYAMTSRMFTFFGAYVILPETEYLAHTENKGATLSILSMSDNKDTAIYEALENYTDHVQSNLDCVSLQTYEEEFGDFVGMFWIVGGGLSFVLALIGILNFMNVMVTGILARKKELAVMEAVGMTGKQMKGMLAWEGSLYIVLTVVFSIIVGGAISLFAFRNVAENMWFFLSYHFTIMPIVICIPVLALIVYVIPVAAYKIMGKESVVERLREKE